MSKQGIHYSVVARLAAVLVFLLGGDTFAGEPYLVRNINAIPIATSSNPVFLGVLGGVGYFSADNGTNGRELWRTDGTTVGTAMVKDIHAGTGSANPKNFMAIGGVAYFAATTSTAGTELWVTDGTDAGTRLVVDLAPGSLSSDPSVAGNIGATVFFVGYDGSSEHQLWRTDGTPSGTYRLATSGMPAGAKPNGFLAASNGKAYFTGFNQPNGAEPWVTDGTVTGTRRLNDVVPGTPTGYVVSFVEAGGYVYFIGAISYGSAELMRIRLTNDAVERVNSNVEVLDPVSPLASPLLALGNLVMFVGRQNGVDRVWRSDGTPSGTYSLIDFSSQNGNSYVNPRFTVLGSRMLFSNHAATGGGLIATDGTVAGTVVLDGAPQVLLGASQGYLYYHSYGGLIRRTDGTVGSPRTISLPPEVTGPTVGQWLRLAGDANVTYFGLPGQNQTTFMPEYTSLRYEPANDTFTVLRRDRTVPMDTFATWGGRLFFAPSEVSLGYEPWISNGTVGGTALLANVAVESTESSSAPSGFFGFRGNVYFAANDGIAGQELWKSDGTSGGTQLVADMVPGANGSVPHGIFSAGDSVLMFARDSVSSAEYLWRYQPSTSLLEKNMAVGPPYTCSRTITASIGGVTFFAAHSSSGAVELWRTDGSIAGTRQVEDVATGFGSSNPCQPVALGARVFFIAQQFGSQPGYALWVTDVASSGAQRISPVMSSLPSDLVAYNNAIYYVAADTTGAPMLWRSDGESAGTSVVTPLGGMFSPALLGVVNNKLLLTANAQSGRYWLWTFDAATNGLVKLDNFWLRRPGAFTQDQGRYFFAGQDVLTGISAWVTDGTQAGTRSLPGPVTGVNGPVWLGDFHNTVMFATDRLWRSDGTANGTRAIQWSAGIGQFFWGGTPAGLAVDDKFFFVSESQTTGAELYAVENDAPLAANDSGASVAGVAVQIDVLANDSDPDGVLNATTVSIVVAPSHGTAEVLSGGQIRYTAVSNYSGADSFTYSVRDNQGRSAVGPATVSMMVSPGAGSGSGGNAGASGGGGGGELGLLSLLALLGIGVLRLAERIARSRAPARSTARQAKTPI